jgi:pantoate--beta-alanine ligase
MRVIRTAVEMREFRNTIEGRVALVATLGGMHAGHEAHLVKAKQVADVTLGWLFLNPTQFSPTEDLGTYPQNRSDDLVMFEKHGTAAVFTPSVAEVYPPGESFRVDPGPIATVLEGARRPGHFVGVATVVAKMFSIIRPDIALFGEKDAQQLRIIEKMNRELGFGIEIVRIPTVREPDGLALSSRNRYLNADQRAAVPVLYRGLCAGLDLWRDGERDASAIRTCVRGVLRTEPGVEPDYVSIADSCTLVELEGEVNGEALLSLAAKVGNTHLIDNVLLD